MSPDRLLQHPAFLLLPGMVLLLTKRTNSKDMAQDTQKVVVVGGGFAGINFVKQLANDERFQVTLVDKNNYHFFPPLLYQVASAFIEPSNISYPFRRLFQKMKNCRFHMGSFLKVNPGTKHHRNRYRYSCLRYTRAFRRSGIQLFRHD